MIFEVQRGSCRIFISNIGKIDLEGVTVMEEKRVLHFGYSANLGGVETFIKNIIMNTDVPSDIVVTTQDKVPFEDEFKAKGSRILRISPRRSNPLEFRKNVFKLIKEHPEYAIVHVHLNSCSSIEPLEAAKKWKRFCIAHSHNSSSNFGSISGMLHKFNKKRINKFADVCLACSEPAGKFIFGDSDYKIVNNGIDTHRFAYSDVKRKKIRQEFSIEDRFTVCHVGMFAPVKNHTFLIDCFNEVLKKRPDSVLILVGEGAQKDFVEKKVEELGIADKVIFTGRRYDTEAIMSASDVFVLPSLFEGLPIVLVEAQSEGLPCIVSDVVTKEAKLCNEMQFLSLNESAEEWANKILSIDKVPDRNTASKVVADSGFDMMQTVEQIENLYKDNI